MVFPGKAKEAASVGTRRPACKARRLDGQEKGALRRLFRTACQSASAYCAGAGSAGAGSAAAAPSESIAAGAASHLAFGSAEQSQVAVSPAAHWMVAVTPLPPSLAQGLGAAADSADCC